jgi:hypothetical protein
MYLLRPTGRFPVGCQDLKYASAPDRSIAADNVGAVVAGGGSPSSGSRGCRVVVCAAAAAA